MVEKENSGKRLKGVLHRTQRYSAPKRGNHRDTADLFPQTATGAGWVRCKWGNRSPLSGLQGLLQYDCGNYTQRGDCGNYTQRGIGIKRFIIVTGDQMGKHQRNSSTKQVMSQETLRTLGKSL